MNQPRSRANRAGQLVFTLVVMALVAWGAAAAIDASRGHWWFWPLGVVAILVWAVLTGTGIAAALGPDKAAQNSRS